MSDGDTVHSLNSCGLVSGTAQPNRLPARRFYTPCGPMAGDRGSLRGPLSTTPSLQSRSGLRGPWGSPSPTNFPQVQRAERLGAKNKRLRSAPQTQPRARTVVTAHHNTQRDPSPESRRHSAQPHSKTRVLRPKTEAELGRWVEPLALYRCLLKNPEVAQGGLTRRKGVIVELSGDRSSIWDHAALARIEKCAAEFAVCPICPALFCPGRRRTAHRHPPCRPASGPGAWRSPWRQGGPAPLSHCAEG